MTVPIAMRRIGDVFRIIGSSNQTEVFVKYNDTTDDTFFIDEGTFVELWATSQDFLYISTDKPVLVMQFAKSQESGIDETDPFMVTIPSSPQYENFYTFTTVKPGGKEPMFDNFVNIIVEDKMKSGLMMDFKALPEMIWTSIAGTRYVGVQLPIREGTHMMWHKSPNVGFGAIMYGHSLFESYGYPAGMRMAALGLFCNETSTQAGDGLDNDCDERVDEELHNNIDDDGDGKIDEDLALVIDWEAALTPTTVPVISIVPTATITDVGPSESESTTTGETTFSTGGLETSLHSSRSSTKTAGESSRTSLDTSLQSSMSTTNFDKLSSSTTDRQSSSPVTHGSDAVTNVYNAISSTFSPFSLYSSNIGPTSETFRGSKYSSTRSTTLLSTTDTMTLSSALVLSSTGRLQDSGTNVFSTIDVNAEKSSLSETQESVTSSVIGRTSSVSSNLPTLSERATMIVYSEWTQSLHSQSGTDTASRSRYALLSSSDSSTRNGKMSQMNNDLWASSDTNAWKLSIEFYNSHQRTSLMSSSNLVAPSSDRQQPSDIFYSFFNWDNISSGSEMPPSIFPSYDSSWSNDSNETSAPPPSENATPSPPTTDCQHSVTAISPTKVRPSPTATGSVEKHDKTLPSTIAVLVVTISSVPMLIFLFFCLRATNCKIFSCCNRRQRAVSCAPVLVKVTSDKCEKKNVLTMLPVVKPIKAKQFLSYSNSKEIFYDIPLYHVCSRYSSQIWAQDGCTLVMNEIPPTPPMSRGMSIGSDNSDIYSQTSYITTTNASSCNETTLSQNLHSGSEVCFNHLGYSLSSNSQRGSISGRRGSVGNKGQGDGSIGCRGARGGSISSRGSNEDDGQYGQWLTATRTRSSITSISVVRINLKDEHFHSDDEN